MQHKVREFLLLLCLCERTIEAGFPVLFYRKVMCSDCSDNYVDCVQNVEVRVIIIKVFGDSFSAYVLARIKFESYYPSILNIFVCNNFFQIS